MIKKFNPRVFFVIFGLVLLFMLPIILTNRSYMDDLGRSIDGYTNWLSNVRPLTELVMIVFSFSGRAIDIAPLTHLAAIGLLSFAAYIYVEYLTPKLGKAWLAIACAMPLVVHLHLLDNYSYKFDVLSMSLAIVLAILISIPWKMKYEFLVRVVASICILSLYQSAMNLMITLVISSSLIIFLKDKDAKSAFFFLVRNAIAIVIGYLIYHFAFAAHMVSDNYSLRHSALIALDINFFYELFKNIDLSLRASLLVLEPVNGVATISGLVFGFIASVVLAIKGNGEKQTVYTIIMRIILAFSVLFAVLFIGGINLALETPVWAARVFIGFGAAISLVVLVFVLFMQSLNAHGIASAFFRVVAIIIAFCVAWPTYTTSFAYGSARVAQTNIENSVFGLLVADLHNMKSNKIATIGIGPQSAALSSALIANPFLHRILLVPTHHHDIWSGQMLKYYGFTGTPANQKQNAKVIKVPLKKNCIYDRPYYCIYEFKDWSVVRWKMREYEDTLFQ